VSGYGALQGVGSSVDPAFEFGRGRLEQKQRDYGCDQCCRPDEEQDIVTTHDSLHGWRSVVMERVEMLPSSEREGTLP
jgi:hypothetical protein